jgi:GTP pyrophosphokinase
MPESTPNEPQINNPESLISHGLSMSYINALAFASDAHAGQTRKGNLIPYISHPIAVSALVMEYGGSEEQAIVALLHDVVEDCNESYGYKILDVFGGKVTSMVYTMSDCAPADGQEKPEWLERKTKYLEKIKDASPEVLLVVACDKLHNIKALIEDVGNYSIDAISILGATPEQILWYYQSVADIVKFTEPGIALNKLIELLDLLISSSDAPAAP